MKDSHKEISLKKMKRLATGLFLLMAVIFLIARLTEGTYTWVSFIRAFAEAAMIGALADWFAVTALFRYPLGIRLPHTSIIPNNKDRIGESLGSFVESNFLTPESVKGKLQKIDIARRISEWMAKPANSELIAAEFCSLIPDVLKASDDTDIRHFVKQNVTTAIRKAEIAPSLGHILSILTSNNKHQVIFDHALRLAGQLFEEYRPALQEKITEESPWWLILFNGDITFYNKIVSNVNEILNQLINNPNHELRIKFDKATHEFIQKLKTSPEYRAKGEAIKEEILQNQAVQEYFANVWDDIKTMILNDIANPNSSIKRHLKEAIAAIGNGMLRDDAVLNKINALIQSAIIGIITKYHSEIANLISEQVKNWDSRTITNKIELEIGKDLQYIRINGTIIGGTVGLLIHFITLLFI